MSRMINLSRPSRLILISYWLIKETRKPNLLALFLHDVAGLRLTNLGGEMCPQALVERWAMSGRQIFNIYCPTEATVSASLAELRRGEPVTFCKPLPNYGLLVVDAPDQFKFPVRK